jgi:magnesium-transporting ATPase (P-type)
MPGESRRSLSVIHLRLAIQSIPISIGLHHPYDTAFRAETFSNRYFLLTFGWILISLVLVTEIPLFQKIFGTQSLTSNSGAYVLLLLYYSSLSVRYCA